MLSTPKLDYIVSKIYSITYTKCHHKYCQIGKRAFINYVLLILHFAANTTRKNSHLGHFKVIA